MRTRCPKWILMAVILIGGLAGCSRSDPVVTDEAAYAEDLEKWRSLRLERLKDEKGWLNLAGLYWLEEGENTFGSDPSNRIVFPEKAERFCGTLTLQDGRVLLNAEKEAGIMKNGDTVTRMTLQDDHSGNATRLRQGNLLWFVIRRGDRYAVRLRDLDHPMIRKIDHVPSYPVRTDHVVRAELVPFATPESITVATPVQGVTETYLCPGELHFRIGGNKLTLRPFDTGNGYFLVFADKTSGFETYGAGRFLVAVPDSAGNTVLDFNRAYNPPCAFTPFATCPMPPRENILKVPIEAGEKAVHLQ